MKIEKLQFEKKEIEIKETYVDTDGKVKERVRKINAPTGRCLNDVPDDCIKKNEQGGGCVQACGIMDTGIPNIQFAEMEERDT